MILGEGQSVRPVIDPPNQLWELSCGGCSVAADLAQGFLGGTSQVNGAATLAAGIAFWGSFDSFRRQDQGEPLVGKSH